MRWPWSKREPQRPDRPPYVLDLRQHYWGHDHTWEPIEGTNEAWMTGWHTPRPDVGDWVLVGSKDEAPPLGQAWAVDAGSRYRVVESELYDNVRDMFRARVVYDPRISDADFEMKTYEQLDTSPFV